MARGGRHSPPSAHHLGVYAVIEAQGGGFRLWTARENRDGSIATLALASGRQTAAGQAQVDRSPAGPKPISTAEAWPRCK
ncbi:hypothetical protein GGTG_04831 [Gaeumannomyces tritici R3-111a-1]|uniref:Uncharacterized protein n=1 Tax=Gaeumannomyces tritici (strain R3-111a-1) TaxID=644352 RepID=J3NU76_GAET3|nr:hypothetical protein GGTG_04831 [Gaeumannomyces tritici R3-111a-1]EJT79747.1 hypothetical protein GGTG_04831 [Gaeumannomyces tritici R3-111a-1]